MGDGIGERIEVLVSRAETATDDVRALIGELDSELAANYAPEQRHGLVLDALFQPHVRFFVAWVEGAAVGCGGIALFADFAEVKRMYVRPTSRVRGVADAIIAKLTEEVFGAGLKTLRLETGMHQIAAIRFYNRIGFRPCEPFEPYTSMAPESIITSVFLERQLPDQ